MVQNVVQLPCDGEGACMRCKATPPAEETLTCATCVTPWHVACLAVPPPTLESTLQWSCPDCSGESVPSAGAAAGGSSDLVAAIKAIEVDDSLTEKEKARKRQELLSGKSGDADGAGDKKKGKEKAEEENSILDVLGGTLNCSFCMQLPERPVTTPCGHNFCLKCFQKWIGQGKSTCAKCRAQIPHKMASQPRINSALVSAIRMAKMARNNVAVGPLKVYHFIHNQDRPEKAFTTDRAQRAGKANAASGKIFVTIPPDHFGPITAEYDPTGQLSHKEKRSAYAPVEKGVRYDGIYRIEKCWRKAGKQGFKVCRYLFVRCDNEPAPWTSDENGDRPRPLPSIPELKVATDVTERKESPSWDFDEEDSRWKWKKPPPLSKKPVNNGDPADGKRSLKATRKARNFSIREKLLKEFSCLICRQVMTLPITTPCAHNFCKSCLEEKFAGKTLVKERNRGGRTLRSKKNILNCPSCPTDISDVLQNPQVNRELVDVIESLKRECEENQELAEGSCEEETDDVEGNPDLAVSDSEIGNENSETAGPSDDMVNPPADCEPKRTRKRMKVVAEDGRLSDDDGKEIKISENKPTGLDENGEVNNLRPGVVECNAAPAGKRTSKRKHADNGDDLKEFVGVKRSREGQEAVNNANESPSSTLQVQSSDEDLE
ncbi:hypothetical protein SLEP1_g33345 [Rubroshorea leprosula]|uniref:RING-type E3 ubiquitin transferase n=1 Tax=Rubroshorea leprosula TaxID=152421 RepID=A0AAV5KGA5_9ROSI|nr:hypothetical protein SLEP1_g33345 [Rubroshorea leprosula]